jgi:hypothetical protein
MDKTKIYKLLFIILIFLVSGKLSYGQKIEINFNAYSGLFSFRGNNATSNSSIISYPYPFYSTPTKFTSNPYGRRNGFSYSLELQGQRLSKRKNIYGLGLSIEVLTSKVGINKLVISGDPAVLTYPATGATKLKNTFFTLNPFIGHRFFYRNLTFDLLAGFDLAFCLKSKETGNAKTNISGYITVANENKKPFIDFRPRIQLKTQIKQYGFLLGYSLGATNYQTLNWSHPKVYTSFLRLGLSYQLK